MSESRFLFKIELLDISPLIWRRFFVPAGIVMNEFHEVVQAVMGWDNDHLWEFTTKTRRFIPIQDDEDDLDPLDFRLYDVVSRKGQVIRYLYDFGDSWEHKLKMEDSQYFLTDGDKRKTGCVAGARACPPEDIGGVWGYDDFCKVMTKPKSKRYKEMMEWYAGDGEAEPYDPERFEVDEVNKKLQEL